MAAHKLFAGARIRRLRRANGLTQAAMAVTLEISPSYLNLIERNQRPITAALMLRLAELFDFDPRALSREEPGGGAEAIRRRLADPLFADIGVDRAEVEELLASAPGAADACAKAAPPRPPRRSTPSPPRATRSNAGATISPISTRRPKRWPTNSASARAISMAQSPSGCVSSTSSRSASCRWT
jgi:transcriptional regulator with XRE-family HTH domain